MSGGGDNTIEVGVDIFAISVEHHRSRVTLITSAYLHLVSSFSGQVLSYEAANLRDNLFPKVLFYFCHELPNILLTLKCSVSISTINESQK